MDVKDKRAQEENKESESSSPKKSRSLLFKVGLPLLLGFVVVGVLLFFGEETWAFVKGVFEEETYEGQYPYEYELDEFTTNPAEPRGGHYMKLEIVLAFEEGDLEDELDERYNERRDRINAVLRSKSVEELQDPDNGQSMLKEEIRRELNALLTSGEIKEVYFREFIIQ